MPVLTAETTKEKTASSSPWGKNWEAMRDCGIDFLIVDNGVTIATTGYGYHNDQDLTPHISEETATINATLLAAAPQLYLALKHAYQRLNEIPHSYDDTDFRLIQNALKKVEAP